MHMIKICFRLYTIDIFMDDRKFYMIQKRFRQWLIFFICILAFNVYASDSAVVENTYEFQNFLEFVKQSDDVIDINDYLKDCKELDAFIPDIMPQYVEDRFCLYYWLIKYSYDELCAVFMKKEQDFKNKFIEEVSLKERIRKAVERDDLAFLKKQEEIYCKHIGKSTDSVSTRSLKRFERMTLLGNLYGDYEAIYNSLRRENILSNPADFLLFLRFMSKDWLDLNSLYVDNSQNIAFLCDSIKKSFPRNTHVAIAAVLEEKKQEKAKKELLEIERRKNELEIKHKKRKNLRLAHDLAQKIDLVLLKKRFDFWVECAQNKLQEKKRPFDQQVIMPNSAHARLINNVREHRAKHLSETDFVIESDKQENGAEIEHLQESKILAQSAKTARREIGFLIRDIMKDKSNRYASDLITFAQENNLSVDDQAILSQGVIGLDVPCLIIEQDCLRQAAASLSAERRCHNPYSLIEIWSPAK